MAQTIINPRTIPVPNFRAWHSTGNGRQALAILDAHRGRFVSVTFTKQTTGEQRTLTCIFSRRYLLGQWRFSLPAKGLIPVWDAQARQIKCIPIDGITEIRAGGQTIRPVRAHVAVMREDVDGSPLEDVERRVRGLASYRPPAPRRTAAQAQAEAALLF